MTITSVFSATPMRVVYFFEECPNEQIKVLHTNLPLLELGTPFNELPITSELTKIVKKNHGLSRLIILDDSRLQVEKGIVFEWEIIESDLIRELNILAGKFGEVTPD